MAITSVNGVDFQHHQYTVGLNNVGSYQVSGMPFCSGSISARGSSAVIVEFPYVTQWIQITNHDTSYELSCSFTPEGMSGSNFFKIHSAPTNDKAAGYGLTLPVKCTRLYFTGSTNFDIVAGLTGIPIGRIGEVSPSGSGVNFRGLYTGV